MSAINIPEAKNLLKKEQVTVQNLLIENGQLIETVAEYQRMGRIIEATKYQERLHANLIYLAKLADSTCSSHLLQEMGGASDPTHESPPPSAEPPLNGAGQHHAALANAGVPYQQQAPMQLPMAAANHTSPPGSYSLQHSTSTTPPTHVVQYQQFPSPTQSSPHGQTNQQHQPTAYPQQQQQQAVAAAMPFQRNLNVPSHSMLFQHQQNTQQPQQMAQQHSIVYATGQAMPTQHHQQYSAYPLLQQQQQQQSSQQFPPSIQAQFPPSTGPAYAPVVITTQSDPMAMGIRQHQQAYQNSHGNHSMLHGTSPGGYMAQQK